MTSDTRAADPNDLFVTGYLFGIAHDAGLRPEAVADENGQPINAITVQLDFTYSRYRLTVERILGVDE